MLTAVMVQVIVGVFVQIHAAITYECAPGYGIYYNTCYKKHTNCKAWQDARNTCHSEGGFLFSVKDLMTYTLAKVIVQQVAATKVLCEGGLWVGGKQQSVSGSRYYWDVDGSTVNNYQYFAPGEPTTNEGCIEIRHANPFNDRLNSHYCDIKKDFLCQGCYLIDHCDIIKCPTPDDTFCEKCEYFYNLTPNRTQCLEETRNLSCANCSCCVDGICNVNGDNETCDNGCTDDHWGEHCMYDCGPNCTKCNSIFGFCNTCVNGFNGRYCNNTCLPSCATCSNNTSCTTCKDGYYNGKYRDLPDTHYFADCRFECQVNCTKCNSYQRCTECQTGTFGTSCNSVCSPGCTNNVCEKSNGYCECRDGFKGRLCDVCFDGTNADNCTQAPDLTSENKDMNTTIYSVVAAIGLVTGLFIALGIGTLLRYNRKRGRNLNSEGVINNEEIPDGAAHGRVDVGITNLSFKKKNTDQVDDNKFFEMQERIGNGSDIANETLKTIPENYEMSNLSNDIVSSSDEYTLSTRM